MSDIRLGLQAEVYLVDGVLLPDLTQISNGSAARAASQGLKAIRAAPTRRLLARSDSSQSKAGDQLPGITAHSHVGHTDIPHHHSHETASAAGSGTSHDPTTHQQSASKSAASSAGSQLDTTPTDEVASKGGKGHSSKEGVKSAGKAAEGKKGPASLQPEAGVSSEGTKSEKLQREAEAERQALAVPELNLAGTAGLSKAARPELSTLTTSGGEGMADSKHTTVSAGSRADKQEPKDELDSLGATTPE